MTSVWRGLRLAVSLLTVVPVGSVRWERSTARTAMATAPLVGCALGAATAGALWGLSRLGLPPLVTATVSLGGLALLTRAMHWDGLADTADGLGATGGTARMREVMKSPEVGAFGVLALVLVALGQAAALGALAADGRWLATGLAVATGRLAICWACRRGLRAASAEGLGAMVAGSQPIGVPLLWTVGFGAAGWFAVAGRPWLGPAAVVIAVVGSAVLVRHVVRRAGGITGDVLGAANEAGVLLALVVLTA